MTIRRGRNSFIESSVLSDLAFLLIIYFIVIAGFNINRGFLMGLPAKDSVKIVLRGEILRFRLDGSGRLTFAGRALDYAEAGAEIRAALRVKPNAAVTLAVAPDAPWQSVVSFVEIAQETGAESFSFRMEEETPE
jgi:biopolymer transport protein ExbD